MGAWLRRLEASALVLALLFAGTAPLWPADEPAGCGCPVPCVRCCCASGDAELCVLRDRDGSAPRSETPPVSRLWLREAVLGPPALLPHPALDGRLSISPFLLPASLVLTPDVPPPRVAA